MNKVIRRIYSIYGSIVFIMTFLVLFPVFVFTIEFPNKKAQGRKLNRVWSKVFFGLLFFKVKIENLHHFRKGSQFVIVSNHFSYLDIPVLGLIPFDLVFIGKSSLAKVPIFGYMFKNLHISVNRNSLKSRGVSILKAKEALDQKSSVVFFPEGGISSQQPPNMARFKDGAFKVALDKQIPIIPITLSYNHLILPDDGRFLLRYKPVKVVIHPPVAVEGLDQKDVGWLKEKCFQIIQDQLWKDNASMEFKKMNT
ncbi:MULTISPECIES: lysophospholipid acyltransferase family protein [Cyclobacterium]|uniref:1-acyl-sn-glycerol-3-phosphate acyltransferase n=1 Tax=Cyclobacterium plantarum TaxID=2716263 RepID=A0ABX0HG32_9BACT|nr:MULTISPECIES: lysophospholipid acyltransferase family protein [Cyclobacterium]MBD3627888.1 1-acyl-sn-glycerol-3-phosphate acyltransferase [Cyclobacterium sp.]NHE59918.1 1-acyl-sn-glycerol-3-phosphate acyltransferase [Cyclobacterium plantarum]